MCANFRPTRPERLHLVGLPPADFDYAPELWPGSRGPFLRSREDHLELVRGVFGLVPHWEKTPSESFRRCYNARSETASTKPSFRDAWRRGHRCVVPADAVFEPCYESGKPVRWAVSRADGDPLLIGGLWSDWTDHRTGEVTPTFSLLTVNVIQHPILNRLHAPEDEKRGVVMLEVRDLDAWLHGTDDQIRSLLRPLPPENLVAAPCPLPPRAKAVPA